MIIGDKHYFLLKKININLDRKNKRYKIPHCHHLEDRALYHHYQWEDKALYYKISEKLSQKSDF